MTAAEETKSEEVVVASEEVPTEKGGAEEAKEAGAVEGETKMEVEKEGGDAAEGVAKGTEQEETLEAKEARIQEPDAEEDARPRVEQPVVVNRVDGTMNCFTCEDDKMFTSLHSEGWEKLLAGCRATHGIKAGKYYFEQRTIDYPRQQACGITLGGTSLTDWGASGAVIFEGNGDYLVNGDKKGRNMCPRWMKGDVVGLLVNLEKEGKNARTLTLWLNGERVIDPVPLPENMWEGPVYPSFWSKSAAVRVNLGPTPWIPPRNKLFVDSLIKPGHGSEFKVHMVAGGAAEDIVSSNVKIGKDETEVVVVVAWDTPQYKEMMEKQFPDHVVLTDNMMHEWATRSGIPTMPNGRMYGTQCIDKPLSNISVLERERKFVLCIGNYLIGPHRKDVLEMWKYAAKKIALIGNMNELYKMDTTQFSNFNAVSLPTLDEGFDSIIMHKPMPLEPKEGVPEMPVAMTEKEARDGLAEWQKSCRMKSRVDDLKPGPWYKEWLAKYEAVKKLTHKDLCEKANAERKAKVEAKKKEIEELTKKKEAGEEGVEIPTLDEAEELKEYEVMEKFAAEDWLLVDLRAQLHAVLHGFKTDCEDAERVSFPAMHYWFYYKIYSGGKGFGASLYACQSMEELLELVPDAAEIDSDGMLIPKFDKDVDPVVLISVTEEAREQREDRVDAGDENAALKFKAAGFLAAQEKLARSAPYQESTQSKFAGRPNSVREVMAANYPRGDLRGKGGAANGAASGGRFGGAAPPGRAAGAGGGFRGGMMPSSISQMQQRNFANQRGGGAAPAGGFKRDGGGKFDRDNVDRSAKRTTYANDRRF